MVSAAVTDAAIAQPSAIPAGVQMRLFSKIWMFDRSIAENDQIVMAVLYQSTFRASEEAKDQLVEAVRADGLKIRCRSEEHTSELQSLTNLVCRLLLEKKKNR